MVGAVPDPPPPSLKGVTDHPCLTPHEVLPMVPCPWFRARGGQASPPPPGWSHDPQTLKFWTQQLSFGAAWQKVVYKAFSTGFMWFLRHLSKPCVLRLGGEDPTGKFCLFFWLK